MSRRSAVPLAWIRLLHPGPSVLVTLCFVAAAAAALRRPPSLSELARLIILMLALQFAIGAVNDIFDRDVDRLAKPDKPLVSGAAGLPLAWAVAVLGVLLGLTAAASFPWPTVVVAAVGLGAGLAYDVGVKRTVASWAPWWIGFVALPLCARAAAQRVDPAILAAIPLALGLALSLHLANALPDISGDRQGRSHGLAVRLGPQTSWRLCVGVLILTAVLAIAVAPGLGQHWGIVVAGSIPALAVSAGLAGRPLRRPFLLMAPAVAVFAGAWFLALP